MLRSSVLLSVLLLLTQSVAGQPATKPYQVPKLNGWREESIPLPPRFAPDMSWKGMEELRFAPGMFKEGSDSFLSYTLLFWLPDDQPIDSKTIEQELLAYFRGLSKAILQRKPQEVDVASFTLAIKEAGEKADKRSSGESVRAFAGELKWTEPFTTGKPQTLHLDLHTWPCEKQHHNCVFICASPAPESAEVWKALRKVRADSTFP